MEKEKLTTQVTTDLLRSVVIAEAAIEMIKYSMEDKSIPQNINQNVVKQTIDQLSRYQREIRRCAGTTGTHFDKHLRVEKMFNIVGVIDLMNRIGIEEKHQDYEELTGVLIDCLHSILYAQKNRKHLYFPKYIELFKLFAEEVKADVNNEHKKILFTDKGELFVRVNVPVHEPKIDTYDKG